MKKVYLTSIPVVLVLVGSLLYYNFRPVGDDQVGDTLVADLVVAKYSLETIAKHATAQDCWFAVEGKVYDVTKFIASQRHPGGAAILQGCGKDASTLFNTRPMGSGTPHSDNAREGIKNFLIGDLQ